MQAEGQEKAALYTNINSPCSYLFTEVLKFEYVGPILDPTLTMHLATTETIRRAAHGQSVTQNVSYPLRSDKNVPNSPQHKTWVPKFCGNSLHYLISSRICTISRVLLMLRNFRLASTSPLLALSMSMEIIQSY